METNPLEQPPVKGLKEWPYRLLGLLLVAGLGIALHLTWHHENSYYGDSQAKLGFCPENAVINCDVVNTSRYSEFLGTPIALFAIPTYLFLLILIAVRRRFSQVPFALFLIGLMTSAYSAFLAGVSYFEIGYGCLWCMGLYAINFLTALIGYKTYRKSRELYLSSPGNFYRFAISVFLVLATLCISGQRMYRATLQKRFVAQNDLRNRSAAELWKPKGFRFASTFYKPVFSADKRVTVEPEDLQPLVGNGKPLAIVYHTPGLFQSDSFAPQMIKLIQKHLPQAQVFVAIAVRDSNRLESIVEDVYSTVELKNIPLFFDLDSANLRVLGFPPNQGALLLIGKEGSLLANQITDVSRPITVRAKEMTVAQWLSLIAQGDSEAALSEVKSLTGGESLVGKCAPAFNLPDLAGRKTLSFNPSALKKPTLLVFWSPTCSHCREELPKLVKYHSTRKNELDIVSITRSRPQRNVGGKNQVDFTLEYAKSIGLNWPILSDSGLVSNLYRVDSTPTTLLLSSSGTVEHFWKGTVPGLEAAYESALREVRVPSKKSCEPLETIEKPQLELSLTTADSKKVSSREIIKRPTLVHFWATWCLPCQEELPHFLKFANKVSAKGVDSLLITVESISDRDKVVDFLKPFKWSAPVYYSPSGGIYDMINNAYSVPRTYLVNSNGEVLRKYLGAQEWQNEHFQELVNTWFQNPL
ncbi:MAG: hypothetical protein EBQ92_06775 [Proteobacteria bacterium]|nr:hypothetical protein [Pseudomonadota bacterium]